MDLNDHGDPSEHRSSPAREERPARDRRSPSGRRPRKSPAKVNYRLMLCIALLVCFVFDILFFCLMLSQCSRAGKLKDEVATLTEQNQSLTNQNAMLQDQSSGSTLTTAIAALPDPTAAQTDSLADLIPQLTDAVYVVRSTGSGYQYLKITDNTLLTELNNYRDNASGYVAAEDGSTPSCTCWVLYADRVVGLAEGDKGFVSMDRGASGSASAVPSGFFAFVSSLFA